MPWTEIILLACLVIQTITHVWSFDEAKITWDDTDLLLPSRRGSFCNIQQQITSGQLDFYQALRGQNLSVAFFAQKSNDHLIKYDPATQKLVKGFFLEVMEELSQRGGFSWRNTVALTERKASDDEDHTQYLKRMVDNYDLFIHCFTATADRYKQGIRFPYYLMDSSLTLVTRAETIEPKWYDAEMFFSFLMPFQTSVWMALIGCFMISGVVYATLESGRSDASQGSAATNMVHATWLSMVTYTGHGSMTPETWPGRLFLVSWSFTILVCVTAYTANLTTSLVVKEQMSTSVRSMLDASKKRLPICVRNNNNRVVVHELYPALNMVLKDSQLELYAGLRDGQCAGAVTSEVDFDLQRRRQSVNPDCNMALAGRSFHKSGGSFALKSDTFIKCTSLVSDVIETLFQDMSSDGWIEKKWAQVMEGYSDAHCDSRPQDEENQEHVQASATIKSMSGIFLIHALCTTICVFLHVGHLLTTRALGLRKSSRQLREGGVPMGQQPEGPEQADKGLDPNASSPKVHTDLSQIQVQLERLEFLLQKSRGSSDDEKPGALSQE